MLNLPFDLLRPELLVFLKSLRLSTGRFLRSALMRSCLRRKRAQPSSTRW